MVHSIKDRPEQEDKSTLDEKVSPLPERARRSGRPQIQIYRFANIRTFRLLSSQVVLGDRSDPQEKLLWDSPRHLRPKTVGLKACDDLQSLLDPLSGYAYNPPVAVSKRGPSGYGRERRPYEISFLALLWSGFPLAALG